MKSKRQAEINSKNVLKKIIPFLAIFIFSIGVATNQFFTDYSRRAKAANEGITVKLTNLSAPITQYGSWKWKASVYATKQIGQQVAFNININWCNNDDTNSDEKCIQDKNPSQFLTYYKNSHSETIKTNSEFIFQHQSLPCGRAYIEVKINDNVISDSIYNTGIPCQNNQEAALLSYEQNNLQDEPNAQPAKMPGNFIDDIMGLFGKVNYSDTSGGAPADEGGTTNLPTAPGATACPIQGGTVTCTSKGDARTNCQHCGPGYVEAGGDMDDCPPIANYGEGTEKALDIKADGNTPVYLPKVGDEDITWEHRDETKKTKGNIMRYAGVSPTGKRWWIQFHHSQPGSGIGIGKKANSGAVGAKIYSGGNHVHVQLSASDGPGNWVPASTFFCN